jgi:hypothetical protein
MPRQPLRFRKTSIGALALACSFVAPTLAAAQTFFSPALDSTAAESRPKTLFAWSVAEASPDADDDGESADRIVTDRPHFSEASSLVGLGTVQLEMGYSLFQDRSGGVLTQTHSFGEPLLRMGLFADWFEFRLGYTYLGELIDGSLGRTWHSGSDDLYVAAKLALAEQAGWFPEMAIFPQLRVPSGSQAFTAGEVLPGFNLAYSWKLNSWIELEANTQLNRRRDAGEHFYTEFIQTINFEYDLATRLGAFTEWIVFAPSGALINPTEHYFHAGFVYFLTQDIQLDVHSAVGLNAAATNLAFTGVGISIRW